MTLLSQHLANLQLIRNSCTEPLSPEVEEAFDKLKGGLEFYEERITQVCIRQMNIEEQLKKTATSTKSNNEHVRNLKKRIYEIIAMCKQK